MKKNLLNLLLILLGVFIFVCCSEELTNLDPVSNVSDFSNIPDAYLEIGEQHNKGLEYAFQAIKEQYIVSTTQNGENPKLITTRSGGKSKLSKKDLLDIGAQAANDFVKENQYFGANESLCREVLSIPRVGMSLQTRSGTNELNYSPELQWLLKKLNKAISRAGNGKIEQFKNEIETLVEQAQLSLSEIELIGFYAGASTAYASMVYWTENHQKWQIALNCPELLSSYTDEELNDLKVKNKRLILKGQVSTRSWWDDAWSGIGEGWDAISDEVNDWWDNGGSDVVGADAGGAVVGAMSGALGGAAAAGVGAGPGAIAGAIGGGCYSSIEESIGQFF